MGWTAVAGIVISIGLLWWTLHDTPLNEVFAHTRSVRIWPFVACVVVATLVFPIRTIRWRLLLRLDGESLPFTPLWHATAIGFMANNLLPARAGEVARAYAARRLTGVRFSTAAGTLVVERIMDGMTLVALLAMAVLASGFGSGAAVEGRSLGRIMLAMGTVFSVVLLMALWTVRYPKRAITAISKVTTAVLPGKLAQRAVHALEGVLEGLDVLRDWRRFAVVTLWSLVVWGLNGLSFLLCFVAFDLAVPWPGAYTLQSLIGFGVAAPSAPGFFGVFEAVTKATLALYSVPLSVAVSYALAYHLFTFVPITLLGLWSLSRAHLHLRDLGGRQ